MGHQNSTRSSAYQKSLIVYVIDLNKLILMQRRMAFHIGYALYEDEYCIMTQSHYSLQQKSVDLHGLSKNLSTKECAYYHKVTFLPFKKNARITIIASG